MPNASTNDVRSGIEPVPPRRISNRATTAMLMGIAGLVLVELCPLALAFGAVALRDMSQDPALGGRRMAISGVVLALVGAVIGLATGDLAYLGL